MKKQNAKTKIKVRRKKGNVSGQGENFGMTEDGSVVEANKKKGGKESAEIGKEPERRKKGKKLTPEQEKAMVEFVNNVLELENIGIISEFKEKVSKIVPEHEKCTEFFANMPFNRNPKIPMLNETRVELQGSPPTYINASRVNFKQTSKLMIAAQLPMSDHVEAFWRMIFQENCSYLLVLCNQFDSTENYTQMMPVDVGDFRHFGTMFVNVCKVEKHFRNGVTEIKKEEKVSTSRPPSINEVRASVPAPEPAAEVSWLMYTVEVLPDGCSNSIIVKVVLYLCWEKGVAPPHLKHLGGLANRIADTRESGSSCVVSVDGVGRTGVQLAVTAAISALEGGVTPNILEIAIDLRNQRAYSIENSLQYATIYQCLLAYIATRLKDVPAHQPLREKMDNFNKKWQSELFTQK